MNFFESQDRVRRNTAKLVFLLGLDVETRHGLLTALYVVGVASVLSVAFLVSITYGTVSQIHFAFSVIPSIALTRFSVKLDLVLNSFL